MKFDDDTLAVLKNFQTINPSIQINEGNVIMTKAATGAVLGRAVVPVTFPRSFAIYDLRRFLSIATLCKNAEVEFGERSLYFIDGKKKVRYGYCDPQTIVVPERQPGTFPEQDVLMDFLLEPDVFKETVNAMGVLGHEAIVFKGEEGKLLLTTLSDASEDHYSVEIGETDHTFSLIFEAAKLNIIPKEYHVTLSKKKFMHLHSEHLSYWIAASHKSRIE